jgi:hypothetical protein
MKMEPITRERAFRASVKKENAPACSAALRPIDDWLRSILT